MKIESWGKSFKKNVNIIDSFNFNLSTSAIPIGNQNSLSDCFIPISYNVLDLNTQIIDGYVNPRLTVSEYILSERKIFFGTPGNSNVTIAGAIASNTYGKEAYLGGNFIKNVEELLIVNSNGCTIKASREENTDLFYSTFSGYGLTGYISGIKFKENLIHYSSSFKTFTTKEKGYEALSKFLSLKPRNFCQLILDLTKKELNFIFKESFADDISPSSTNKILFPIPNLSFVGKNKLGSLNALHTVNRLRERNRNQNVEDLLFPINRYTDPRNFTKNREIIEIQFSIPLNASEMIFQLLDFVKKSIKPISSSIKFIPYQNETPYLTFTQEGFVVNFTFDKSFFNETLRIQLLNTLVQYGCKINLAKDTILDEKYFNLMYPESNVWKKVVAKYDLNNYFQSNLSKRLNLK